MRRRYFLLLPLSVAGAVGAVGAPSKNDTARAGNAFTAAFAKWAEVFNRVKPGILDAAEVAAWDPLPKLWRNLEHVRMNWIRG